MKKLFAMLMALTILMTMAACGQQTTDEAGGTVDPGAVADRDTSGQVDMPADDAGTPELGSVNGGTYTNEFAGIGCTLFLSLGVDIHPYCQLFCTKLF